MLEKGCVTGFKAILDLLGFTYSRAVNWFAIFLLYHPHSLGLGVVQSDFGDLWHLNLLNGEGMMYKFQQFLSRLCKRFERS